MLDQIQLWIDEHFSLEINGQDNLAFTFPRPQMAQEFWKLHSG